MTNTLVFIVLGAIALLTLAYVLYKRWQPSRWYIGPRINGKNYSKNLPLYPDKYPGGWQIQLDKPDQELDYVTRSCKSLDRVVSIRVKASVFGEFYQAEDPSSPPTVSLILQRKDDDWSGRPYRWYLPNVIQLNEQGLHDFEIRLDDPRWVSVMGGGNIQDTIQNIARVGLTFGGSHGLGHGVSTHSMGRFSLSAYELLDSDGIVV